MKVFRDSAGASIRMPCNPGARFTMYEEVWESDNKTADHKVTSSIAVGLFEYVQQIDESQPRTNLGHPEDDVVIISSTDFTLHRLKKI